MTSASSTKLDFANSPINQALTAERKIELFSQMVRIRRFEQAGLKYYQAGKIGGFLHLYIGQEAVAVGTISLGGADDHFITAYRDHGHALAVGMSMNECMAEMYGKQTGCSKGKGGSMHFFAPDKNFWGGHGIVAGQTPLGLGLAYGLKYLGKEGCCLCYLGDGAVNQGAFHESLNIAALFGIPVVYVIENNGYSMGTAIHRGTTMSHELTIKGRAHGLKEATMDGMDVIAVQQDMHELAEWCRENSRPAFVDMRCYRYKGHSMSDPRKYRTREEEERHESNDPIGKFERTLLDNGVVTDAVIKEIMASCREEVRDSIQFANESPEPPMSDLYTDVFVEPWGRYPGSSQPEFTGGATNVCAFRATNGKEGLV